MALTTKYALFISEPKSYKTALKIPYWLEAINDEIEALKSNNTWTIAHRPTGVNTVESKWVFRMKLNEDGTADRFKARLLSHGYSQIHGLDYDETFSPVVKATMIRLILAIAVHLKWSMRQVDIKNIFLHGFQGNNIYGMTSRIPRFKIF